MEMKLEMETETKTETLKQTVDFYSLREKIITLDKIKMGKAKRYRSRTNTSYDKMEWGEKQKIMYADHRKLIGTYKLLIV